MVSAEILRCFWYNDWLHWYNLFSRNTAAVTIVWIMFLLKLLAKSVRTAGEVLQIQRRSPLLNTLQMIRKWFCSDAVAGDMLWLMEVPLSATTPAVHRNKNAICNDFEGLGQSPELFDHFWPKTELVFFTIFDQKLNFLPFFSLRGGGSCPIQKSLSEKNWGGQKRRRWGLTFLTKSKKKNYASP